MPSRDLPEIFAREEREHTPRLAVGTMACSYHKARPDESGWGVHSWALIADEASDGRRCGVDLFFGLVEVQLYEAAPGRLSDR